MAPWRVIRWSFIDRIRKIYAWGRFDWFLGKYVPVAPVVGESNKRIGYFLGEEKWERFLECHMRWYLLCSLSLPQDKLSFRESHTISHEACGRKDGLCRISGSRTVNVYFVDNFFPGLYQKLCPFFYRYHLHISAQSTFNAWRVICAIQREIPCFRFCSSLDWVNPRKAEWQHGIHIIFYGLLGKVT